LTHEESIPVLNLKATIDRIWADQQQATISDDDHAAVRETLEQLTTGEIRAAERQPDGTWIANEWVKKAILLHFRLTHPRPMEAGALHFFDKVPVQGNWGGKAVRVVPPATVRHGAHVAKGAVLMPCYINIGAYVGSGTMIDTWSTVGSCAQVGANCHISGGVGIGGVLEPLQATPVIIEDNVFVGARGEVAEGVIVREGAVLAMGCYVSASTRIYDATQGGKLYRGEIPARAVVVPGSLPSADGTHSTYALIIKKYRDAQTDAKTALNDMLR
jgi:2,3,4,5-tetrahydropyridine-2-carboxylate N-succinyltransferase